MLLDSGFVGGFMFFPVLVLKSVGILSFLIPDTVGETIVWLDVVDLFFLPQKLS